MDMQIVEIGVNRLAAAFEVYVAYVLRLENQTFAVS